MSEVSEPKHRSIPLYMKVLFGALLGIAVGAAFGKRDIVFGISGKDLGDLGLLVIKLLRALATPLILFAVVDSFMKTRISARRGVRLVLICALNVSVAMVIGLTILNVVRPGERWRGQLAEITKAVHPKGLEAKKPEDPDAPEASLSIVKNVNYYVPGSLVKPFIYNNVITIVLLSLLVGASLRTAKERLPAAERGPIETVANFFTGGYQLLIQALEFVIQAIPYAVFGIVAQVVGQSGMQVFSMLWVFLATVLVGLAIHSLIYYPLVAWLWGKKPPRVYFGKGADAIMTGLSTNSSLGTMPITLICLKRMGVSDQSARLGACIGTNLNNDGITLYEAMTALFLAQALGISMTLGQQMVVILASVMAGAGIAGIPEAGLIVLPLVLGAAGLPAAAISTAIPLIMPVDFIIARCRSGVNVMADMLVSILLDRDPHVDRNEAAVELPDEVSAAVELLEGQG